MSGRELTGIGVGHAAARGKVLTLSTTEHTLEDKHSNRTPDEESQHLTTVLASSVREIREETVDADPTVAAIMDALLILFEDPELIELATPALEEGFDAATALVRAINSFSELMAGDEDFASRAGDLTAIAMRVAHRLRGTDTSLQIPDDGSWVVVASDLTPLETSQFGASVVGVVTELGGPTSHTAIICRALGIPAVVSCTGAGALENGQEVLVDPVGNRVIEGGELSEATQAISFVSITDTPLITVRANIGSIDEARASCQTSARGIGLLRTEVAYLGTTEPPSAKAQAAYFEEMFRESAPGKIIVRTIDAGSDKPVPFLALRAEDNPALGVRGFRMVTHYRDFLQSQLEAIGIAIGSTGRDVGVMAPMVSTVEEVETFAEMCAQAGITQVGIMVETPAIVALIPWLRDLVSFVSIGTNDLSQYLFAADRLHPELGALNSPWQPALLHQVARIAELGRESDISVGVCGEAAADPLLSIVFAGMGIDSVSAAVSAVDSVHEALTGVTIETAQAAALAALSGRHVTETKELVRKVLSP